MFKSLPLTNNLHKPTNPHVNSPNQVASTLSPPLQIPHHRHPPTTRNDPLHLLLAIINLLMFRKRRYKRKVARHQILPLLAPLGDDRPAPAHGVDDGILLAVVVDGGCRVGFRNHHWMQTRYQVMGLRRRVFVRGVPEAHTLSDWSLMAPWRIMPSVWPVVVCRAEALVIWTDWAIVISISRRFRYDELS